MGIKKGLTAKEVKALQLVNSGKSDLQAYLLTHNCSEKTASKNASKWFANARAKVSASDWFKLYNLDEERLAKEIDRKLRAQAPVVYQGIITNYTDDNFTFEPGKAYQLQDGNDLTIIAAGETVWHAMEAGKQLAAEGISTRVLDMSWLKPCDEEAVRKAAAETGRIITVEEHSKFGGLGAMVTEIISENPVPVRILGIPDENVVHGNSKEIFHYYGLDAEGIVKAAKTFVK